VEAAGGETEPSDGEGIGGLGDGAGDGEGDGEGEGITGQGLAGGGRAGGGAGAGAGSGPGEDPHAALLAHLRAHAHRCYPPPARRRGIQGVVGLSFCIDEHGRPERMRIERSSGSALLDEAARSCVIEGAAPLPGPVGCVVLDLPFRLR
jgi:protein TonB